MESTRLQAGSPSPLAARQRRSPSGPAVARPSMARLTGTVRRSVVPDIERSTTHCHSRGVRACFPITGSAHGSDAQGFESGRALLVGREVSAVCIARDHVELSRGEAHRAMRLRAVFSKLDVHPRVQLAHLVLRGNATRAQQP
jgi:hypothetical protein